MMTSSHQVPHQVGRVSRKAIVTALVAGMLACAGDSESESAAASQDAAPRAAQASAVFELGGETYTFERATCDLDDSIDDDVLVRASGTAPDGRRMSLEVERREVGEVLHDRVTLYLGNIADGDHWNAYASGEPGGTWRADIVGEPLDGPLVVIEAGGLTAEGTFAHETRDESQPGSLRVSCTG
jgi:hypothetical protein